MQKKVILAIISVFVFAGCNHSNEYPKKEVFVNNEPFGEFINKGYERGHKIYLDDEVVGFLDSDNILYQGKLPDGVCGGEYVGLCESTGENSCNVPNYVRATVVNGAELIPPYMSFNCGEKL